MDQAQFELKSKDEAAFIAEVTEAVKAKYKVITGNVIWIDDNSQAIYKTICKVFCLEGERATIRRVLLMSIDQILEYGMGFTENQADWLSDRIDLAVEVEPGFSFEVQASGPYPAFQKAGELALVIEEEKDLVQPTDRRPDWPLLGES